MRYAILFTIAVTAMLGLTGCSSTAKTVGPPIQPEHSGSIQGEATLSTQQPEVLVGEYILLTVRFHNTGPARWFYNPAFDPAIPAPAMLALYDPKHRFLHNMLHADPTGVPTPAAWVFVPSGGTVEGHIDVPTDYFPGKPGYRLKPATYTLQLIYSEAYATPQPAPEMLNGSTFEAQLTNYGAMASNAIPVRLAPLPGNAK